MMFPGDALRAAAKRRAGTSRDLGPVALQRGRYGRDCFISRRWVGVLAAPARGRLTALPLSCRQENGEMFAVCPPGAPFRQGRGGPALGTAVAGAACGPDSNSNFVGERQMGQARLRDAAPRLGAARPRLPGPGVRSPPEGAEVGGAGGQNAAEEPAGGCGKPPSSPAEDNGYASSSLSIDSPDSTCGSTWDPPAAAPLPGSPPQPGVAEPEPGTLFPALAEAVQHLQDKERFKEREKEKHHIQLVMYRRLALLRWIHGLQQKVVDQQNRLQESFDTILDNRKELIRRMQHGPACPAGAATPSP
uniref:Chromosome 1 open reading frame 216 n=1 Tax=Otus sunia TaxID=257818 RepID=A0A8C8B184_9STRI